MSEPKKTIRNFKIIDRTQTIINIKRGLEEISTFEEAKWLLDNFKFEGFTDNNPPLIVNGFAKPNYFGYRLWSFLRDVKQMGLVSFDIETEEIVKDPFQIQYEEWVNSLSEKETTFLIHAIRSAMPSG